MLGLLWVSGMVRIGLMSSKVWASIRIYEVAKEMGVEVGWIRYTRLRAYCMLDKPHVRLWQPEIEPDVVIFRLPAIFQVKGVEKKYEDDVGLTLLAHLEAMGIPAINGHHQIHVSEHKHLSRLALASKGIPIPLTGYAQTPEAALDLLDNVIGYPAVIKPLMGTWGRGVVRVDSREEAERDLKGREVFPVVVEEYVEKVGNRDMRIFVVGEEAVAGMYRIAQPGDFITNVHRGGRVKGMERVPDEVAEMAVKASRAVGLEMAGIDIMEHPEEGYMVIETNSVPGFEGLYRATGIDVSRKIVEHAVRLAKK